MENVTAMEGRPLSAWMIFSSLEGRAKWHTLLQTQKQSKIHEICPNASATLGTVELAFTMDGPFPKYKKKTFSIIFFSVVTPSQPAGSHLDSLQPLEDSRWVWQG